MHPLTSYLPKAQSGFLYYPFGSSMMEYKNAEFNYSFDFNGKETDSETGLQDYGFRIYNKAYGRFLSVDPLAPDYPWYTPYQFAGNKPIWAIDLDGLEEFYITGPKLDRTRPHIKYELWTTVNNRTGETQYFMRRHYYNMNNQHNFDQSIHPLTDLEYKKHPKWAYRDAGKLETTTREFSVQAGRGTSTSNYSIDPSAATVTLNFQFDTDALADGATFEYRDENGEWQSLYTITPVVTFGGSPVQHTVTVPPGASEIRITITPDGTPPPRNSVWNYSLTIEETPEVGFYSSPWLDGWSNDYQTDWLAIPRPSSRSPETSHTAGACSHQDSETHPTTSATNVQPDPCAN